MKNSSKPEFMVVVQCCQNCSQHSWCSRHDEGKYDEHYLELKRKIEAEVPQAVILKNQTPLAFKRLHSRFQQDNRYINEKTGDIVQYPRLGSFQVYAEGYLIFSKIQSNLWPCHNRMVALIYAMSLDKKNGKDLARFSLQNRIFHENDEVFKITYNKLIQKEILEQQNFGKYSRLNSSLQRSNIINSNGKLDLTPQLKKGIKIRKISSTSKKKIEPLSYSHVDVVKRFDEERSADVVSYTDKKNSNKYIRPIQKHRKDYEQFKSKRKVDIPSDNWRNEAIVPETQIKDVVHKRPSVRIMKRVIDTKIDQKKSEQSPAQQKIPSKVQPIKVFLPQVNKLNEKKSPKISHKQDQEDYQQLYDEQQQKQKKKKIVPPVQQYDEQFEQQKSRRDTQKSQGLKGSIRSDIKQDIKPFKNSQKVEEIIEDFEYGQLTKSQNRNIKKKKPEQDIEQIYEGIQQQVQDEQVNKRKQEQLKKIQRIQEQKQRQKLRQQQIQKQKKLRQQRQIQQQKERKLQREKQQQEKKQKQRQIQRLEAEKKQKDQQQLRLKQQLRMKQQQKKKEEMRKLQEQRIQKERKLKQQQEMKKQKQSEELAIKNQQQRLKKEQLRKKQEQETRLRQAEKLKQQKLQQQQQQLLKQQKLKEQQQQKQRQLLRIQKQQQQQRKQRQQMEQKQKDQKQKAQIERQLKEKEQKQRQLQQKQKKRQQQYDQKIRLQEQEKKQQQAPEQKQIVVDQQYGEQFQAQQTPQIDSSKNINQQHKTSNQNINQLVQTPVQSIHNIEQQNLKKQKLSIKQIKPILQQQSIPTIHWLSQMIEGDYKMSNKEGIVFNDTPSQSLHEIEVQKQKQNIQKIQQQPKQTIKIIEENNIPEIHCDSKMFEGDYKMSNKEGIPFLDTPSQSLQEIQLEKIQQFKNQNQSSKIQQTQQLKPLVSQLVQKIQIPEINWQSKMVQGDYRLSNREGIPFDQTPGHTQHNIPQQTKEQKQTSNSKIVQSISQNYIIQQKNLQKQDKTDQNPIQIPNVKQQEAILPIENWSVKYLEGRFVIINNLHPTKQYALEQQNTLIPTIDINTQKAETQKVLNVPTLIEGPDTNQNKIQQKGEQVLDQQAKKQQHNLPVELPVEEWQAQSKDGKYFIKNTNTKQIFQIQLEKSSQDPQIKTNQQVVQSSSKVEIVPQLAEQQSIPYEPKIVYWESGSVQGTFITRHIPQKHKIHQFVQRGSFKKTDKQVEKLEEKYSQQQFQNQNIQQNKEDIGQQAVPELIIEQTHWVSRFNQQNFNLQKTTKQNFDKIVRQAPKEQDKPFIQFVQSQRQVSQQYLKSQKIIERQLKQSFNVTQSQITSLKKIEQVPIRVTGTVTYWQSKCSGQQFQTVKMIPTLVDEYLSNLLIVQKTVNQSSKSIPSIIQSQKQVNKPVEIETKQRVNQNEIRQQTIHTSNKIPIGLIQQVNVNWQSRYSNDIWSLTKRIPEISA